MTDDSTNKPVDKKNGAPAEEGEGKQKRRGPQA